MKTIYNDANLKRGRKLASGKGQYDLMDVCFKNKWKAENTILVVDNADDLDSTWTIYAGYKEEAPDFTYAEPEPKVEPSVMPSGMGEL